ncbi:MAG: GIY-YIG nuclease family protein [Nanoarchaeota archaeon]
MICKGFIYKAIAPNGKIYIGQSTKTLVDVINRHEKTARNPNIKRKFRNSIKKYGIENFKWEILKDNIEFNTDEKINNLDWNEIWFISTYDSKINGLNHCDGGEGRRGGFSEENIKKLTKILNDNRLPLRGKTFEEIYGIERAKKIKKKISKNHDYSHMKDFRNPMHDPEVLKKIIAYHTGAKRSAETCKRISDAQKKRFKNPEEIENLSKRMKGRPAWNKGLTKETDPRINKYSKKLIGRKISTNHILAIKAKAEKVIQLKDNKEIKVFDSACVAAEYVATFLCINTINKNIATSIRKVCNGKAKTAYGFQWKSLR